MDSKLQAAVRPCDVVLVVPPFAGLDRPSIAAHLLQACARRAGFEVAVFYANLALAARIGEKAYQTVAYGSTGALLGERFFCAAAYDGVPFFGREAESCEAFLRAGRVKNHQPEVEREELTRLATDAAAFADEVAEAVTASGARVVGSTTTFEQTAASYAILRRVKALRPEIVTILGGANCEGEMGAGLREILPAVDVVFSGESESAFPEWLRGGTAGRGLIAGPPCADLDALPPPDYAEYYEQLALLLPESPMLHGQAPMWLPYESSRGCWWGEKHHCTFCGLNAQTMALRSKSADTVIRDLRALLEKHPSRLVCMADNIMPFRYFQTLVPRLAEELPDLHLFYEQKANLSLTQVVALVRAGIREIQPGIESLSTSILKLMDKGVSARQNLSLLRYARAAGLSMNWNLLYALPGDAADDYRLSLEIVKRIAHLQPPSGMSHLSIDRFSPYFDAPSRYGVSGIQPMPAYAAVLPEGADPARIGYHFVAKFRTGVDDAPEVLEELGASVGEWADSWRNGERTAASLAMAEVADDVYVLVDTRGLPGTSEVQFFDREQAAVVLTGAPPSRRDELQWAIDQSLLIEVDGWLVPLATADPEILAGFEVEVRRAAA